MKTRLTLPAMQCIDKSPWHDRRIYSFCQDALSLILITDYYCHQRLRLRFAKNCLKNENFSKLFPLSNSRHGMKVRDPLKYKIKKANTERYKKSSVIYMQRLLNEDCKKRKKEMNDLNNELSKSNKWKMNKSPFSQVNYVSTFDYHCRK